MSRLLFILCLCCSVPALGQGGRNFVPAVAYEWYPRYVTFLPENKIDSVLVYADTDIVPIIYKVNRWNTEPGPQVDSLCHVIEKVLHDQRVEVAYVWIGGSASPEGPTPNNKILGRERAWVLAEYLLDNTSLEPRQLRIENLWEDWYSVARTLQRVKFPHRGRIINIIENEPDWQARKEEIRAIDGGRTWQRLIEEIFPPFRNARMVIVCHARVHEPPGPVAACPLRLPAAKLSLPPLELRPVAAAAPAPTPDTRFLAVKTNLLFAAALCANLGFEVELWPKWSLDVPVWYSPYDITSTRKLRLLATQPEIRWWPKKAGGGHFLGLHAHVAGFNVAVNDHGRYQDPNHALWGIGIGYGYALNFGRGKHWGLEFNIGVGFAEYDYDIYENMVNGPKTGSGSDRYWGVTRAGITLTYKWWRERKGRRWMGW